MICPNPNCKSNIPDDSQFCPECRTPINNIKSLCMTAQGIVNLYQQGYYALVKSGVLPPFSEYLTAEGYELIIQKKREIAEKHLKVLRQVAYEIATSYQKGYEYYVSVGNIPPFSYYLSAEGCQQIINYSHDIVQKNKEIEEEEKRGVESEDGKQLTFNVNGVSFNMIKVQGGTFDMKETIRFLGLGIKVNVQSITLPDYFIGETLVTQRLWQAIMDENPSAFKGNNLPVENVSWIDCQHFITKLNSITGRTFHLPTEAEWEFAARGGINSMHFLYSGSNNIDDVAWYINNSYQKTHIVATKQPNELGLYDMSGNTMEMCFDIKGSYNCNAKINLKEPTKCHGRVICRGGCWLSTTKRCSTFFRGSTNLKDRSRFMGVRLALLE